MKNFIFFLVTFCALVSLDTYAQESPSWKSGTPMPTPRKEISNATVTLNGEIYVLGGVEQSGSVSNVVDVYNPVTDSWRSAAPLPLAVWRSSAAVANGRIYIIGGYQFQSTRSFPFNPTNRVFEYNPDDNSWAEKAPMSAARGSLSSINMDGEIHVLGGASNDAVASHEVYDPATNQWRPATAMSTTRSGLTTAVADGKIYAFGGYTLGGSAVLRRTTAEVYDPATQSWSFIANPPQARLGIDAVTVDGKIIVIGGGDTPASRTIQYDPATNTWSDLPDMPVPVNFMGVARVGHTVVAVGGGPVNLSQFDAVSNTRILTFTAPFQINAGLNDAWVNADAALQGMFITVFPNFQLVFVAWFTFDSELPPGDATAVFGAPDQRWITGLGSIEGNRVELNMELTTGGLFNSSDPLPVQDTAYGSMVLEFTNCSEVIVNFDIPSAGESGTFAMGRVLDDNVALCEALLLTIP